MYSILVLVTKFVERLSLDFHYFSWIHMSKMKLLKFIPYFCRNILTTQFSNCVILIKANQSRMDHIDLAAKDHWWPHQIQQIESRAHMEKHGVRHTGSRASLTGHPWHRCARRRARREGPMQTAMEKKIQELDGATVLQTETTGRWSSASLDLPQL
jgi:hypothetical protein